MGSLHAILFLFLSDSSAAGNAMKSFITPVMATLAILATLACTFFLITSGITYMTSSGKPENLAHAKLVMRNALIGLVLVLGAGLLTTLLSDAYNHAGSSATSTVPSLVAIQSTNASGGLVDVLIKAVTGLLLNIIQTIGEPFMQALSFFTSNTPLMGDNPSVFNLWLAVVGITDALFVLVVALLGFHVMSYATFGLDEIEFKHLLPQIGLIFLLINSSLFIVDAVISLSNALIHALSMAFPPATVWSTLSDITKHSSELGLATLLIMIVFLILSAILLVYYVGRLVTLYLGAVLAPLVLLMWLLPGFKDFVETAIKTYVAVIFVLFVHVVILLLAASIFNGLLAKSSNNIADPIMAMVVGVATIVALLKTQGVLAQLSFVSIGPKTARKLGGQFANGISYMTAKVTPKPTPAVAK